MLTAGIRVKQAQADADRLIVQTGLSLAEAEQQPVVVVGTVLTPTFLSCWFWSGPGKYC